jgi:hypothetical protein
VPVRDLTGRVVALKVRCDTQGDGPKYLYISSTACGGPGPGARCTCRCNSGNDVIGTPSASRRAS